MLSSARAGVGGAWGLPVGGTRDSHDVVGLQPRVGRGVDEDIGERVLVVIHLVCKGHGPVLVTGLLRPFTLPCPKSRGLWPGPRIFLAFPGVLPAPRGAGPAGWVPAAGPARAGVCHEGVGTG